MPCPPYIIAYGVHLCPPLFTSNEKGCTSTGHAITGLFKAPVSMSQTGRCLAYRSFQHRSMSISVSSTNIWTRCLYLGVRSDIDAFQINDPVGFGDDVGLEEQFAASNTTNVRPISMRRATRSMNPLRSRTIGSTPVSRKVTSACASAICSILIQIGRPYIQIHIREQALGSRFEKQLGTRQPRFRSCPHNTART